MGLTMELFIGILLLAVSWILSHPKNEPPTERRDSTASERKAEEGEADEAEGGVTAQEPK